MRSSTARKLTLYVDAVREKRPISCNDPPRYTCTSYIPSTGSRLRNDIPKVHSTEDICSTDEDSLSIKAVSSTIPEEVLPYYRCVFLH
ncbi:LIM and SH3 domain protein F42H10.3, partial [Fasciolopsis buskii]